MVRKQRYVLACAAGVVAVVASVHCVLQKHTAADKLDTATRVVPAFLGCRTPHVKLRRRASQFSRITAGMHL